MREGTFTKAAAVAGVISAILGYLALAFSAGWPPFPSKTGLPAVTIKPPIRAIQLPAEVFGYRTYNNETRQSWRLGRDQVNAPAYAYGYYEDDQGIWLDATAVAGGDSLEVVKLLFETQSADGQTTKNFGPTTCVWEQDADPNTPRHGVVCFRLDRRLELSLVVNTHTTEVGDIEPANLTDEIWNRLVLA